MPDDLLTTEDLANLVHAPISSIRYWRQIGYGPQGFRVGKRILYRRTDVEAWLAELARSGA